MTDETRSGSMTWDIEVEPGNETRTGVFHDYHIVMYYIGDPNEIYWFATRDVGVIPPVRAGWTTSWDDASAQACSSIMEMDN